MVWDGNAILEVGKQALITIWAMWQVQFITYHVLVNVGVAIMAALHTGEFQFHKMKDFLIKKLIPYAGLCVLFQSLGDAIGKPLGETVFTVLEISLTHNLADNLIRFADLQDIAPQFLQKK